MIYPKYEILGTLVSAIIADEKGREYLASKTANNVETSSLLVAMELALAEVEKLRESSLLAEKVLLDTESVDSNT